MRPSSRIRTTSGCERSASTVSKRIADQTVQQPGVGDTGGREHLRDLRLLGEAGHRVDLVEDGAVSGQEEVDASHSRTAEGVEHRDGSVLELLLLCLAERSRDQELGTAVVLGGEVEEPR